MELRRADEESFHLLNAINCPISKVCVDCERALLGALDGSCQTPVGGLAEITAAGDLVLKALVATPDGAKVESITRRGNVHDALALGKEAGLELRRRMPELFSLKCD